ncbi:LOW QUALITY PROTEIN: platelet binding protein GspB [Colossoma macropomum]|uniref:LOW QUALITY PROTEIN: platelet binding protein GspB n=1 Tax=Colossoma macropomum TaxID=42526 RepID=UPI00186431E9|nr:LOW QUALITY PROTEIN: platelet binding protein GspB [Colossoma macropomum]
MNSFKDATLFIDLSFLSTEEEAVIRQVLLRDEDLKRLEIGRVRRLRNSVPDSKQLKVLSGEWFEELRSKRYGRQPAISAVVRSSMRWKKSAGHKPLPFLNVVPEEKDGEKEEKKTRPELSVDPRSIHPALSVEVSREYKDEDITLEVETQSSQTPAKDVLPGRLVTGATVPGSQSAGKPKEVYQEKTVLVQSSKLEPVLQPKSKGAVATSTTTNATTANPVLNAATLGATTSAKPNASPSAATSAKTSAATSITSANAASIATASASATTTTKTSTATTSAATSATTSATAITTTSATTSATASATTSATASATTSATASAGPRRKVSLPPALQKDASFEENWVKISLEANTVESTAVEIKPKATDGNMPVETLAITSFSETRDTSSQDQSSQPVSSADSISTGPKVEAGEIISSRKVTKIEVKQTRTVTELAMNKDGSGLGEEVAQSQSLREDPKGAHELLIGSLQGQESSPKLFTLSSVEMMKKQAPASNTVPQKQKEEIIISDFKRTSPTRMDELDVNVEESLEYKSTGPAVDLNVGKDTSLAQNRSAETNRDRPAGAEVVIKNAVPERKDGFDVELGDSESADKKTVELAFVTKIDKKDELPNTEEGRTFSDMADESNASKDERRSESDILASVYARALRTKSPSSKNTSIQDPKQEKAEDVIPSIVIVPSESSEPKDVESVESGTSAPEAPAETPATPSFVVDTWEDEGVDSEDDSSSVSSYGSDLSGRRGFSASTLSVTERTGSLLSVYSDAGDFGNVMVQGSVEFALMYSPSGELVIMVEQCQDLAIANPRKQRTDPYVKTYLYPDKRSKRKTSIKKRTVNPVFVESLRYKVKREELPGKTLNLSVWHNDSLGRNVFLGQVELSLKNWDWGHQALTWYNLQPKNADNQESQEYCGLLSVSLKYIPPEPRGSSKLGTGEIHVWLREARQLRRLKAQGVNSFVKCYMLPDTSKKSRQKTRVVKKSLNPVYNHTMVYDGFRPDEVREACCELTAWDNNKLSNQFLGGVRLSLGTGQSYGKKVDWMDSANEEVEVWQKMMAKPNSWVEADLPLRASMTPRK